MFTHHFFSPLIESSSDWSIILKVQTSSCLHHSCSSLPSPSMLAGSTTMSPQQLHTKQSLKSTLHTSRSSNGAGRLPESCTRKNHLLGSISPHLIFSEQLINQILWRSCSLNFLLFSVQRNGIRKAHSLWLLFMVRKDKKLQLIKDKIPENAEIAQNNLLLANNTKSLCKLNTYSYAA